MTDGNVVDFPGARGEAAYDVEGIERDYYAGLLSLREIARKHGVSHTLVAKLAARYGWRRDLSARIIERARAKIAAKVRSEERRTRNEEEIVDEKSDEIADVQIRQQTLTDKLEGAYQKLVQRFETWASSIESAQSSEEFAACVRVGKDLATSAKVVMDAQRRAYGLDRADAAQDGSELGALLEQLAERADAAAAS